MTRIVVQSVLLAALPFILYAVYIGVTRKGGVVDNAPWFWLITSGLVLALLGFGAFIVTSLGPPEANRLDSMGRIISVPAEPGPPPPPPPR
jgi:hypothetical protein